MHPLDRDSQVVQCGVGLALKMAYVCLSVRSGGVCSGSVGCLWGGGNIRERRHLFEARDSNKTQSYLNLDEDMRDRIKKCTKQTLCFLVS